LPSQPAWPFAWFASPVHPPDFGRFKRPLPMGHSPLCHILQPASLPFASRTCCAIFS
jgi:hypothetical protein